ncbi:uncharacterized protein B0T15DRAFT_116694 [Chaetomium strumarium]|uniref:P-loop containing nucleoside triphosphate hydrolase protein n=1 Tax=Chaetomium strumarium TaxID=1170767 RepID=A0AAJ0M4N9_9PEZI|nr:hypothetical protein B0T15DRAFT_116694 [Chaetomium strumarium]
MGGVPSVPRDRTRKLEVISGAYSRTGTVSLSLALETLLDGPVMHGGTQLIGREDAYVKLWHEIFEARKAGDKARTLKLLREATAGFVAITDVPGNCLIPELRELYPEAQVIVVNRDKERWFASIRLIVQQATPWWLRYLLAPCPGWRWFAPVIDQVSDVARERARELGWGTLTPKTLEEHNNWVRDITPPEQFHVIELKDGWEPLCQILNKPVPKEPFPRANDAEAVKQLSKDIFMKASMVWVGILTGTAALSYGGWWAWTMASSA